MPGITSKLKEHLESAKHEAKEKVNPFSQTNKYKRMENHEHQNEIRKTEREAYQKEELHQAEERGKHHAQGRTSISRNIRVKSSNFAEGTRRAGTIVITHNIPRYKGANDLHVAGGDLSVAFGLRPAPAPKKLQAPAVITTVSKAGTVKIIRPVEKTQQKDDDGFFDLAAGLRQPSRKGFRKREKRIGDMF
jgi:hypothetical protein